MSEEYVKISLDRYDDFVADNKMANVLSEKLGKIEKELENIIDSPEFNMNVGINKKIYKLYERIILNE